MARASPVQRTVSRFVFAEQYEASLRACMEGARGCREMLLMHSAALRQMTANPQLMGFVRKLLGETSHKPPPAILIQHSLLWRRHGPALALPREMRPTLLWRTRDAA